MFNVQDIVEVKFVGKIKSIQEISGKILYEVEEVGDGFCRPHASFMPVENLAVVEKVGA